MAELNLHPDVKAFKEFAEKNPQLIRAARSGDRNLNDYFKHYQKYGEADSFWDQFLDDKNEPETKETADKKKKWSEQLKGLLEKIEFDNIDQHLKQADSAIGELKKLIGHFSEIKSSQTKTQTQPLPQPPQMPQPPHIPTTGFNRRFF
ncbi:MAG TPA: hypothetical protein GXZ58_11090 [Bacilli bacterium]|nr:hypothetical protein [Bacilli bacterium]